MTRVASAVVEALARRFDLTAIPHVLPIGSSHELSTGARIGVAS
jgi:hypothetical protein